MALTKMKISCCVCVCVFFFHFRLITEKLDEHDDDYRSVADPFQVSFLSSHKMNSWPEIDFRAASLCYWFGIKNYEHTEKVNL